MFTRSVDPEPIKAYDDFLKNDAEVDPLLIPVFGPPINPYVNVAAQMEVHRLLATYQPLCKAQLLPGAPLPVLAAPGVFAAIGYQYHHAQIAIQKVMAEIESPHPAFALPALHATLSNTVICDLTITYANGIVILRRLHKF